MNKNIAVLAGDGIGPEVMQSALRILYTIGRLFRHHFNFIEGEIGGVAYEYYYSHCPDETLELCQKSDAILFGSVGGPIDRQHEPKWKNCEANSILKLRQYFNLNINIRPITVYAALFENCPLKPEVVKSGFDFIVFRELNGGIYYGKKHKFDYKSYERTAMDESIYTENQIENIAHTAFQAARLRQKRVCSVDKANVLATSQLWREVMHEVSNNYPDVNLSHLLIDNCVMQMIRDPHQFDVIVTENMFGDIISDLGAALPGSLGLIPSASLSTSSNNQFGLYEPSGGSAPDLAGKDIANPTAQILSAAMMLRYSFGLNIEANLIEEAVKNTIVEGVVTKDLSSQEKNYVTTSQFTETVNAQIEKISRTKI